MTASLGRRAIVAGRQDVDADGEMANPSSLPAMLPSADKILPWLPVGLLLLGIVVYGVRIEFHNSDPQRGSAFAMFSSVDIGATRRVIATVPGDPAVTLEIPTELEELRARLQGRPSEAGARVLADRLLGMSWELSLDTATVGGSARLPEVRVEVVGLETDRRVMTRRVFADVAVSGPAP